MMSSALRNWQQENRFRTEGDAVYGVYQGVGFSAVDEDGGKLFVFMLSGADNAFDSIEDMLAAQSGALGRMQVGDVENYLALFYDESSGTMSPALMTTLLDFVAANCRTCGFKAPNVCVKCGAPANKRAFHNNMVQPMCEPCRDSLKKAPARRENAYGGDSLVPQKSSYDENYDEYAGFDQQPRRPMPAYDENFSSQQMHVPAEPEGSMGKGFIGALLGSIAGLVPYYITVLINFQLPALCFLAGIGALLGYVAFGGVREKKSGVSCIISTSAVVSILTVLIVAVLQNVKGSMADTMAFFAANIPWFNLILAIISILLGVAVSIDRLVPK
ncbi:MAG: hypothetical protein IJP17_00925, partial [Clostridia bacterium]|nr:hypothetical protein [Clostridia bacterium]